MKKLIALFLAALMLFSLAACAKAPAALAEEAAPAEEAAAEQTPAAEEAPAESSEPVKLRIAVRKHMMDTMDSDTYGTKYTYQKAAEELGYEIEWICIDEGDGAQEKVATMLAGNLPDVFWGPLEDYESLVIENRGLFVPLEDKMEQCAPDFFKLLTDNVPGWEQYLTHDDGHIYSLPGNFIKNYNNQVQGTAWINKAWLDKVGMDVPTNQTELEAVLKAFRDEDVNGNGDPNDEIPIDYCQAYWAAMIEEMAHMFGITMSTSSGQTSLYNIEDGKVVCAVDNDTYRAFLEYFNYLCSEKLANVEGTTQSAEQYTSNIANGKVGIYWGWTPLDFIADQDLIDQYVPLGAISADGYTFRIAPKGYTMYRANYLVTTACENVEAALKFYNYFHTSEKVAVEGTIGPEGLMWEMVDGVPTYRNYTAEEAKEFGYSDEICELAGTTAFKCAMGLIENAPLKARAIDPVEGTNDFRRKISVDPYVPYYAEEIMSQGMIPADAQEEFTFATDGLIDYVLAFSCDAIVNGVTDDSWNAYLEGLTQHGMDAYIQFYQNYFDGTF